MTQDKTDTEKKSSDKTIKNKRTDAPPKKIIIRRLPPSLDKDTFLEQISPVPEHDYLHFVRGAASLGENAFSRAYINFINVEDIIIFQEKFDGYIFVDGQGQEYTSLVELAPFQKVPKKKGKKPDPKTGTIDQDADYMSFVESLEDEEQQTIPPPESFLEEIEAKERELKANHGVRKMTTPLIDYILRRKEEKKLSIQRARDDKKRKELERKRQKEDERRKKREKERLRERDRLKMKDERDPARKKSDGNTETAPKVVLLKNPEREKDKDEEKETYKSESKGRDPEFKGYGLETKYRDRGQSKSEMRARSWKERERDHRTRESERGGRREGGYKGEEKYSRPGNQSRGSEPGGRKEGRDSNVKKRDLDHRDDYLDKKPSTRNQRDHPDSKDLRSSKDQSETDHLESSDSKEKQDSPDKIKKNEDKKFNKSPVKMENKSSKSRDREGSLSAEEGQVKTGEKGKMSERQKVRDDGREGSSETGDEGSKASRQRIRYKDRPERAIYNPAKRAAERRKEAESKTDRPERSHKANSDR